MLDELKQQPPIPGCDHPLPRKEIKDAILKLKNKAPGESGLTPQMWKALTTNDITFEIVETIILDFWDTELSPEEWETGS